MGAYIQSSLDVKVSYEVERDSTPGGWPVVRLHLCGPAD